MANLDQLLHAFPVRRIKPSDGMAVTADLWEEAHDYHRHQIRAVARLGIGTGILTGLQVIASDPADRSVYVTPGAGLDGEGNLIVVAKPVAFNLASAVGQVRLFLSFGESAPRMDKGTVDDNALRVRQEYAIEAGDKPPAGPHIELARISRTTKTAVAMNATDPAHPLENEIDQRFRTEAGPKPIRTLVVRVIQLGKPSPKQVAGINALARSVTSHGLRVAVDVASSPAAPTDAGDLIYLAANGPFTLKADEMKGLYAALQRGAVILAESARGEGGDPAAADSALRDLFQTLGVQLREIQGGHPLLTAPHLFAAAPHGAAPGDSGAALQASENGVVFSGRDYATLWQGERAGGPAAREEIRAAHEFGYNLFAFAQSRAK